MQLYKIKVYKMSSTIRHCLLQVRDAFINVQLPEMKSSENFLFAQFRQPYTFGRTHNRNRLWAILDIKRTDLSVISCGKSYWSNRTLTWVLLSITEVEFNLSFFFCLENTIIFFNKIRSKLDYTLKRRLVILLQESFLTKILILIFLLLTSTSR